MFSFNNSPFLHMLQAKTMLELQKPKKEYIWKKLKHI